MIGVTILIIICGSFIYLLIKWLNDDYDEGQEIIINWTTTPALRVCNLPRITFKQFLTFYNLNPDSWTLTDYYIYKNNNKNLSFTFSHADWEKYVKFKKSLAKQEEIKQQNQITINLLKEIKKDIGNVEAQGHQELEQVEELIKKVQYYKK